MDNEKIEDFLGDWEKDLPSYRMGRGDWSGFCAFVFSESAIIHG